MKHRLPRMRRRRHHQDGSLEVNGSAGESRTDVHYRMIHELGGSAVIDYDKALITIADFGLGSDSPIILYYDSLDSPTVMYLRWSGNGQHIRHQWGLKRMQPLTISPRPSVSIKCMADQALNRCKRHPGRD